MMEQSNPFEVAIQKWSSIGLGSLQRTLDDQGLAIVEHQKASVLSRKDLASRTRDFRKLAEDEKLAEIRGLLKFYQTEIDNLTNRCKFSETCFMNIYKSLSEAPDPLPLLEASIDSVTVAKDVAHLQAENARLEEIVARQADYDIIKERLLGQNMQNAQLLNARVGAREAELKAEYDEKEKGWRKSLEDLQAQLEEARSIVRESRVDSEVAAAEAQRAGMSHDQRALGKGNAEVELISADLERVHRRLVDAEKRNVELRSQLESARNGQEQAQNVRELEDKARDLEQELVMVRARLGHCTKQLVDSKTEANRQVSLLEREVHKNAAECDRLQKQVAAWQDYDQIKEELKILKSVEFLTDGDDTSSLDYIILSQNKKLTSELSVLRTERETLEKDLVTTREKLVNAEKQLERSRELVSKLESDLTVSSTGTAGSTSGSVTMPVPKGRISPTSSIINGRDRDMHSGLQRSDPSLLPIITQQRDRFRTRNSQLEQQVKQQQSDLRALRKEIESHKAEKVELYEVAKYVSNYRPPSSGAKSRPLSVSHVEAAYDESLSPFQQFRGREADLAFSRMNVLERALFVATRVLLSSTLTRSLFALYCVGLHLLVFVVILTQAASSTRVSRTPV